MRKLKDSISTSKVTKTKPINLDYEGNIGTRQPVDTETFYTPQPVAPTLPEKKRLNVDTSYLKNINGLGQPLPKDGLLPVTPTYANAGMAAGNMTPTTPTISTTPETTTEPVDSYEQWLQKNADTYKNTYNSTVEAIDKNAESAKQAAENQRIQAEQNAERERERANVDARSSYAQNLSQYGKVGEQMQNMGLSGSGYGEYLNAQAYAQQRAEQQAANATATAAKRDAQYTADQTKLAADQQANSDKLNAKLSYEQNVNQNAGELAKYQQQKAEEAKAKAEQEETERKAAYAELLSQANNGSYSKEQLQELATKYGLSESDIAGITDAADKYKQSKYSENYASAIDNINQYGSELESDYLDNLLELDYISKEQYDSLKEKYNNKVALESKKKIEESMESGDYGSIEAILENADKLYADKKISQSEYQDIYGRGQEAAISGLVGKDYGGNFAGSINDFAEANKELDDMYAAGKLSKEKYDSLKAKLNEKNAKGVTVYVQGLGSGRKNDDIDITIGQGSRNKKKEYDLLCGDEVTDPNAKEALNKHATGGTGAPSNGTLVVYAGKMYIYTKKGWRNVISDHSKIEDAIADYLKNNKK